MLSPRILAQRLETAGSVVLVTVAEAKGSTPREAGAQMAVFPDGGFLGTIGGGALEWRAIAAAQRLHAAGGARDALDQALGPDLGQCCGGRMRLDLARYGRGDTDALLAALTDERPTPLLLFGAGHVGRALVIALAPLPFAVTWIDERPNAFPSTIVGDVTPFAGDSLAALAEAPPGALALVMTHSHPLDLSIVSLALPDPRFAFVGLIGSATKRARFERQMRAAGIEEAHVRRLVCPIGLPGIGGKEPAVIAAGVAAQLLTLREDGRAAAAPARLQAPLP